MEIGLSLSTIKKIQNIFAQYPQIKSAILYGSRAKGTYQNGSDIDLALQGNGIDLRLLSLLNEAIDDLLLPYKFDLSNFSDIKNKELLEHINRIGIEFYKA